VSGLKFPKFSAWMAIVYIIGRQIFSTGYRSKGAQGRLLGVIFVDLALVLLVFGSFYSGWLLGGGMEGFCKLFCLWE